MAEGRGPVNFVGLLAVLAATSFVLPLLVQGCQALGLPRGVSVSVSSIVAAGVALLWLARVLRAARTRGRSAPGRGAGRPAPATGGSGGVDGVPMRLREAEEEQRASL